MAIAWKRALTGLIGLLLGAGILAAQEDSLRLGYAVQGTVVDAQTGKVLESVHIAVSRRQHATVTNADGGFVIKSDSPIRELVFSHLGYKPLRLMPGQSPLKVRLTPEAIPLSEAKVVSGDAHAILLAAIKAIPDNYDNQAQLQECFYRETVRKRNRYTYISEAVARLYKTSYVEQASYRDRAALEKGRVLISQRRTDTLGVVILGGPAIATSLDLVKNQEALLNLEELQHYSMETGPMTYIDNRPQLTIRLSPADPDCEYPLYFGTIYLDMESLAISRMELSLDMSNQAKATRMMLVSKPMALRFFPKECSIVLNYRLQEGCWRMEYLRTTMRFDCDWRHRLFRTSYKVVNELVTTDLREPALPISRAEMFRGNESLQDKVGDFQDPDFWKDYNIIEPSESLENAIGRLKKQY